MRIIYKTNMLIKIIKKVKNWPTYLSQYVFKPKQKNVLCVLRNKIKIINRGSISDKCIINDVWVNELYSNHFKIKQDFTIFDIGGHIGTFSMYAAKKASKGKVIAFEPFKESYDLFNNNMTINKINNVKLIKKAVSSKEGKAEFFINEENKGSNSLHLKTSKMITVDTTTLLKETKNFEHIDLLKLDCEGAEFEILMKSPENVIKKFDRMVIEYHPLNKNLNEQTLIKYLKGLGYLTFLHKEHTLIFAVGEKLKK